MSNIAANEGHGLTMPSRVLLEVALSQKGNFKLELHSNDPAKLYDRDTLLCAIRRTKELLEKVIFPEIELRAKWKEEDEADALPPVPEDGAEIGSRPPHGVPEPTRPSNAEEVDYVVDTQEPTEGKP